MDDDKFYPSDGEEISEDELDDELGEVDAGGETQMSTREYVVPNDKRRTSAVMSKFELTEVTAIRAAQIAESSDASRAAFIEIGDLTDPISIAEREISMRRCSLNIRRKVGSVVVGGKKYDNAVEVWAVNELGIPDF